MNSYKPLRRCRMSFQMKNINDNNGGARNRHTRNINDNNGGARNTRTRSIMELVLAHELGNPSIRDIVDGKVMTGDILRHALNRVQNSKYKELLVVPQNCIVPEELEQKVKESISFTKAVYSIVANDEKIRLASLKIAEEEDAYYENQAKQALEISGLSNPLSCCIPSSGPISQNEALYLELMKDIRKNRESCNSYRMRMRQEYDDYMNIIKERIESQGEADQEEEGHAEEASGYSEEYKNYMSMMEIHLEDYEKRLDNLKIAEEEFQDYENQVLELNDLPSPIPSSSPNDEALHLELIKHIRKHRETPKN